MTAPTPRWMPLLLALLALPARALEPAYDHVTVRAGVYVPSSSSVRPYGSGMDAELAVGRAFLPFLAGELAIGVLQAGDALQRGGMRNATTGQFFDAKERYELVPVTLTVRLILPAGSIEPYLALGGGIYFGRLEREAIGAALSASRSDTFVGGHGGLGATLRLGGPLHAGVDARYVLAKMKHLTGGKVEVSGMRATATLGLRF